MLTRTAVAARRIAVARRVRVCRARHTAGLAVLHPVVNLPALAQVMVEANLLPERDRHSRAKITAALMKSLNEWCGL